MPIHRYALHFRNKQTKTIGKSGQKWHWYFKPKCLIYTGLSGFDLVQLLKYNFVPRLTK